MKRLSCLAIISFSHTFHTCSHVSNKSIWRLSVPLTTYVMLLSPYARSTLAWANGTGVDENALSVNKKSQKSMYSPLAAACASLSRPLVDETLAVVVVGESSFG